MNKKQRAEYEKPSEDNFQPVPEHSQGITEEKLRYMLPKGTNKKVTKSILDKINSMGEDTDLPQNLLEEEFMSYLHLMGKMKGLGIEDVINATKYCNLKRNYSNNKSWAITFPHRYDKIKREGGNLEAHVAMYNGAKIVRMIDEQLIIPAYLQYRGYFDASVKKQFEIMNGNAGVNSEGEQIKVSAMVVHLAAKELAMITKQPDEAKLDIKISGSDEQIQAQEEMNIQLKSLVSMQKKRLTAGEDIVDVQALEINFDDVGANNGS